MPSFDIKDLSREALEGTYEINLVQFLIIEAKLDKIKKELAVAACALEDGELDISKMNHGLLNLIAYIEVKSNLPDEYNTKNGSLDIVNIHLEKIRKYNMKLAKKG